MGWYRQKRKAIVGRHLMKDLYVEKVPYISPLEVEYKMK